MTQNSLTVRSLAIGLIFGGLIAMANIFLMLTVGLLITAAMVSVIALFAYASFFRAPPPSSEEAVTAYTVHKAAAFAFSIFPIMWVFLVAYNVPRSVGLRIPDWIVPDSTLYEEVLRDGIIFSRSWVTPLAWIVPVAIVSGIGALMVVIWIKDHLIEEEGLTFPQAQADIQLIKSLTTEKFRMDYLFYGLVIGFFFDFILIHYPTSMGVAPQWLKEISQQLQMMDLTPYLHAVVPGAAFTFIISVGFLGLGMLMSPKSAFNMVGGAVAFYVILSAFLVSRGTIDGYASFSNQWPVFRYPYGLSLAAGLLIAAVLGPIVLKMASPLISGARWKWKPPLQTVVVFIIFCAAVLLLFGVLSMERFVTVFPLTFREALMIGSIVLATFVLGILIKARIAGESGIVWLANNTGVSDFIRRFATLELGITGFEGFAISESLKGTRFAAGLLEALKVGKAFGVKPRHQYLSALVGWCFGWLLSTPFAFLIWHYYGVGRGALPMVNMQGYANVIVAFAAGRMEIVFDQWFFLIGFIIAIVALFLQKRSLPFVAVAIGIGAFVGPIYVSTFFLGGLIRVVLEKVKGGTWIDERGKPFFAGLVLGGLALAPLLMVVVNALVMTLGGG